MDAERNDPTAPIATAPRLSGAIDGLAKFFSGRAAVTGEGPDPEPAFRGLLSLARATALAAGTAAVSLTYATDADAGWRERREHRQHHRDHRGGGFQTGLVAGAIAGAVLGPVAARALTGGYVAPGPAYVPGGYAAPAYARPAHPAAPAWGGGYGQGYGGYDPRPLPPAGYGPAGYGAAPYGVPGYDGGYGGRLVQPSPEFVEIARQVAGVASGSLSSGAATVDSAVRSGMACARSMGPGANCVIDRPNLRMDFGRGIFVVHVQGTPVASERAGVLTVHNPDAVRRMGRASGMMEREATYGPGSYR